MNRKDWKNMHQNVSCHYTSRWWKQRSKCDGEETYSNTVMNAGCEDLAMNLMQRARRKEQQQMTDGLFGWYSYEKQDHEREVD